MANKTLGNGRAIYGSQKCAVVPPDGAPQDAPVGPYVFKNIKRQLYAAKRSTYTDEMGAEDGQSFHSTIPTFTGTMQFKDKDQSAPLQFSKVALKRRGVVATDNFIIYECGETYDSGGETMMDVSLSQDMDPVA